jgi:macrolide-specific efflux system membrane fusion protein
MKLSRRTLVNSALGVVILGALVGGFLVLNPFGGPASSGATRLTSRVQQGVVSRTITATGAVQPAREVAASFSVSGTIAEVDVALGDTVAAGQKLASLSTSSLRARLSAAYSSLATARSNLALADSNLASAEAAAKSPDPGATGVASVSSSKQQVNSAKSAVTSANSTVVQAQADLAAATLKAPIAGLVIAVDGTVGDAAGGGSSGTGSGGGFATIADVSKLTVTANIAEADIASVTVGQSAEVAFPALPDAAATAVVTAIAPTATSSNSIVTYATTVTLDDVPDSLRLGQTATVTITTASSAADALYIPSAAITTANGVSTVEVVDADGTTSTVTVELGIVGDAGTEIASGLTAGETVVLGTVSTTTTTDNGGFGGSGFGGTGFGGTGFTGRFDGGTDTRRNPPTDGNR